MRWTNSIRITTVAVFPNHCAASPCCVVGQTRMCREITCKYNIMRETPVSNIVHPVLFASKRSRTDILAWKTEMSSKLYRWVFKCTTSSIIEIKYWVFFTLFFYMAGGKVENIFIACCRVMQTLRSSVLKSESHNLILIFSDPGHEIPKTVTVYSLYLKFYTTGRVVNPCVVTPTGVVGNCQGSRVRSGKRK